MLTLTIPQSEPSVAGNRSPMGPGPGRGGRPAAAAARSNARWPARRGCGSASRVERCRTRRPAAADRPRRRVRNSPRAHPGVVPPNQL